MPAPVQMKTLLEAGVHFGHQTRRWDPRMRPFIFTERNGIHIIDLQQTVRRLDEAMQFVRQQAAQGKTMLHRFSTMNRVMTNEHWTREQVWDAVREGTYEAYRHRAGQHWEWRLRRRRRTR